MILKNKDPSLFAMDDESSNILKNLVFYKNYFCRILL